jgi:hypothetical protein
MQLNIERLTLQQHELDLQQQLNAKNLKRVNDDLAARVTSGELDAKLARQGLEDKKERVKLKGEIVDARTEGLKKMQEWMAQMEAFQEGWYVKNAATEQRLKELNKAIEETKLKQEKDKLATGQLSPEAVEEIRVLHEQMEGLKAEMDVSVQKQQREDAYRKAVFEQLKTDFQQVYPDYAKTLVALEARIQHAEKANEALKAEHAADKQEWQGNHDARERSIEDMQQEIRHLTVENGKQVELKRQEHEAWQGLFAQMKETTDTRIEQLAAAQKLEFQELGRYLDEQIAHTNKNREVDEADLAALKADTAVRDEMQKRDHKVKGVDLADEEAAARAQAAKSRALAEQYNAEYDAKVAETRKNRATEHPDAEVLKVEEREDARAGFTKETSAALQRQAALLKEKNELLKERNDLDRKSKEAAQRLFDAQETYTRNLTAHNAKTEKRLAVMDVNDEAEREMGKAAGERLAKIKEHQPTLLKLIGDEVGVAQRLYAAREKHATDQEGFISEWETTHRARIGAEQLITQGKELEAAKTRNNPIQTVLASMEEQFNDLIEDRPPEWLAYYIPAIHQNYRYLMRFGATAHAERLRQKFPQLFPTDERELHDTLFTRYGLRGPWDLEAKTHGPLLTAEHIRLQPQDRLNELVLMRQFPVGPSAKPEPPRSFGVPIKDEEDAEGSDLY